MWWVSAFGGKTVWRVAAIVGKTEERGRRPMGCLAEYSMGLAYATSAICAA